VTFSRVNEEEFDISVLRFKELGELVKVHPFMYPRELLPMYVEVLHA